MRFEEFEPGPFEASKHSGLPVPLVGSGTPAEVFGASLTRRKYVVLHAYADPEDPLRGFGAPSACSARRLGLLLARVAFFP